MRTSLAEEPEVMRKLGTIVKAISCALVIFAVIGSSSAFATNYYVATYGNDSNSGTSTNASQAWATLAHAVSAMSAGDTAYMRGGSYAVSSQINMTAFGSSGSRYTITNYPGEVPTLNYSSQASGEGIRITGAYWQLYGLVITNAFHNGINIRGGTTAGMGSFNRIERCVVVGNRDSGILIGSNSGTFTAYPSSNTVINCDAMRNFDSPVGGNADGFSVKWTGGPGNTFIGCRAWENSDDGWDLWMTPSAVLISNCWTWRNGSNVWASGSFAGNGNGFKLGGNFVAGNHRLVRSLAYQNVNNGSGGNGVDQNNNTGNLTIDNVTSWANKRQNFYLDHNSGTGNQSHLVRNNVSFSGGSNDTFTGNSTQQSNSWQVISPTVNSNDFVSMDASQLTAARQADGSLPIITLVHPVPGGRLVDKGIIIPGDAYNGSAPDLGAFETAGGTPPPVANFTGIPTSGLATLLVTFTDSSTGSITNRFWNFGDGNTTNFASATNPAHTYNAGTYNVSLTVSGDGGNSNLTRNAYVVATNIAPPVAGFTAIPTNGTAPLLVNFTDISTGSITNRLWDFGDGHTTNFASATNPSHTYAAGVFTASLTVSGPGGNDGFTRIITAYTEFQAWQLQNFGCTNCPQADADTDADGDGLSNTNEFLAGTNPINATSALRIIATSQEATNLVITWTTAGGRTNVVQATGGDGGNYTNNFADISGNIVITGSGDQTTNYTENGGATNNPSRYYRVRLAP